MRTLTITKANYVDRYKIRLSFSDDTSQLIDFEPFLANHPHPQHDKYRQLANFKQFHLEHGNIVWGEDWDLIFPIVQLHQGFVAPAPY